MNILHIIAHYNYEYKYQEVNLAELQAAQGHNVTVIAASQNTSQFIKEKVNLKKIVILME